jgi:serine/threonine protein kinase
LLRHEKVTDKADIWSFGLILYELCAGEPVFDSKRGPMELADQIRDEGSRPEVPDIACGVLRKVIEDCWKVDPDKRPSAAEIFLTFEDEKWALMAGVPAGRAGPTPEQRRLAMPALQKAENHRLYKEVKDLKREKAAVQAELERTRGHLEKERQTTDRLR